MKQAVVRPTLLELILGTAIGLTILWACLWGASVLWHYARMLVGR